MEDELTYLDQAVERTLFLPASQDDCPIAPDLCSQINDCCSPICELPAHILGEALQPKGFDIQQCPSLDVFRLLAAGQEGNTSVVGRCECFCIVRADTRDEVIVALDLLLLEPELLDVPGVGGHLPLFSHLIVPCFAEVPPVDRFFVFADQSCSLLQ